MKFPKKTSDGYRENVELERVSRTKSSNPKTWNSLDKHSEQGLIYNGNTLHSVDCFTSTYREAKCSFGSLNFQPCIRLSIKMRVDGITNWHQETCLRLLSALITPGWTTSFDSQSSSCCRQQQIKIHNTYWMYGEQGCSQLYLLSNINWIWNASSRRKHYKVLLVYLRLESRLSDTVAQFRWYPVQIGVTYFKINAWKGREKIQCRNCATIGICIASCQKNNHVFC